MEALTPAQAEQQRNSGTSTQAAPQTTHTCSGTLLERAHDEDEDDVLLLVLYDCPQ